MTPEQRAALRKLRFNHAFPNTDVWKPSPFHVPALHAEALEQIGDSLEDARVCRDSSPIGVAIRGEAGAGKTHLLGAVREMALRQQGYFALVELTEGVEFWESVAAALKHGLLNQGAGDRDQLHDFLARLSDLIAAPEDVREIVLGEREGLTPVILTRFVHCLRRHDGPLGQEVQDTLRALILLGSSDFGAQDVGHSYLQCNSAGYSLSGGEWGFVGRVNVPHRVVRQTSRLLALTGPTIIAVDQLDGLFAQSTGSILRSGHSDEQGIRETLGPVAEGLLQLRESTARTLTVAACLPDTWTLIKTGAAGPVADRFREISILERIPSEEIAYAIVAKRFAVLYGEAGFQPPHPTWPVAPTAFTGIAGDYTPRLLMQFIEKHIGRCLGTDQIDVLEDFEAFVSGGGRDREPSAGPPVLATGLATGPTDAQRPLAALDTRYAELRECADVVAAIDPTSEDVVLPELLAAGLHAWVIESRVGGDAYVVNPATTRSPPVHATLRHIVDARSELDVRWAFRGLAATNALAVTNRVKSARTRAEPVAGRYPRRLIILRNEPWPNGPRSTESLAEFLQAGGEVRPISESDLRTFSALRTLLADDDVGLASWLTSRRPARGTTLLRETLKGEVPFADAATVSDRRADVGVDADRDEDHDAPQAALAAAPLAQGPRSPTISVGTEVGSGGEYPLDLVALREHTLVIGASGSGKSVVVRTMVEACALQGISSIVLDSNNDLARLGDRWPEIPATWGSDEIAAAARYHDATDVVVWTPGISEGRPLSLPSLPDLTAAPHGSDEQQEILNEAISILAPRAKLTGSTGRASKGEAVLRQALLHHAERQPTAATSLTAFIKQLANLPAAVLTIPGGQQIAADLAGLLEAARTNDPLFAGDGTPLDVGVLLRPKSGKRARVSVISLVGLGSDDQRQAFVNQLQLALMTWLRAHPERANALGGLYVMDEAQAFAPTAGRTACTNSTNTLAAQARKFGLGLVFATQAPRSLQTKIVNSCGTQFVGRLSGSASLAAARDLAQSRGSVMLDVGMLGTGAFYATRPGDAFTKVATRLCLSHHPQGPLTRSEVVTRAAASLASEVGSEA